MKIELLLYMWRETVAVYLERSSTKLKLSLDLKNQNAGCIPRNPNRKREKWHQQKVYGLIHRGLWITAPYGQSENQVVPPALALCPIAEHAWVFKNIETALDKVDILKVGFGIYSEPKAIKD